MPTYMILMNLTERGAREIKGAPDRIENLIANFEGSGGKLIGFFALMGGFDYVAIGDVPSDEAAMTFIMALNARGFVKTTSFKAFTIDEFTGMARDLP